MNSHNKLSDSLEKSYHSAAT